MLRKGHRQHVEVEEVRAGIDEVRTDFVAEVGVRDLDAGRAVEAARAAPLPIASATPAPGLKLYFVVRKLGG